MKSKILGLIAVSLLVAHAPAYATMLELQATAVYPALYSGFTVTFNDLNSDGMLEFNEIVSFSGAVVYGINEGFTGIDVVPSIPTIAAASYGNFNHCDSVSGSNYWCFNAVNVPDSYDAEPASNWTYSVASVPEPATFSLLALGLVGVGLMRRRKTA